MQSKPTLNNIGDNMHPCLNPVSISNMTESFQSILIIADTAITVHCSAVCVMLMGIK